MLQDCILKLQASRGLNIQYIPGEPLVSNLEIKVDKIEPFTNTCIPIRVLAEIASKDNQITIISPWAQKPIPVSLSFTQPLSTSSKLYTVNHRKFVQISVIGHCDKELTVGLPTLNVNESIQVQDFNIHSSQVININFIMPNYQIGIFLGNYYWCNC